MPLRTAIKKNFFPGPNEISCRYRLLYCAAAAAPEEPNTPGFAMTRFALIPLAILANACASAEDVQDNLTDMTHELHRDIEDMSADYDRSSAESRQHVYDRARDIFGTRLQTDGCEMFAALVGGWVDRSFRMKADMIGESGSIIVNAVGQLQYTDNRAGTFGFKGHIQDKQTTVLVEGDWYREHLEADVSFDGANDESFRLIGLKAQEGLGGAVIAAVADCS